MINPLRLIKGKKKTMEQQPNVNVNIPADELMADVSTQEEALAKVTVLLADKKKREVITDLNDEEIKLMSAITAVSKSYKMTMAKDFINELMLLRISKNRLGRKEIIDLSRGVQQAQAMNVRSRLRRILMGGNMME
jgi:hypothetical protein